MSSSERDPPSGRGRRPRLLARGIFALVVVELVVTAAFAIATGRAGSDAGLGGGEIVFLLRDLARGIYPPLLADRGLVAALEAQARKAPVPVTIEAGGVERAPQEVEAAIYFSVLEALQNVSKYAEASEARVTLARTNGHLAFTVVDDGRGFDPAATGYGTGLQGIADRLGALDGRFEIRSAPGRGTTVVGEIPL